MPPPTPPLHPRFFRQVTDGPSSGHWVLFTAAHQHHGPSAITQTLIIDEYKALRQAGHTVLLDDVTRTAERITALLTPSS